MKIFLGLGIAVLLIVIALDSLMSDPPHSDQRRKAFVDWLHHS